MNCFRSTLVLFLFLAQSLVPVSAATAKHDEQDDLTAGDAPRQAAAKDQAPVTATISIDWTKPGAVTTRRQFSLNATAGANPDRSAPAEYAANMAYMNPGLLRYHKAIIPRLDPTAKSKDATSWVDYEHRTWNRERIRAAFDTFRQPDAEVMINIPTWPQWMDKEGKLAPDCEEAFAQFCAELVRIVNVEQKRGVRYFEITNERDFVYWRAQIKEQKPPQPEALASLFNRCAQAMKVVDPSVKIGGPACAGVETAELLKQNREFVRLTLPNLDFFSFHAYATGTPDLPDSFIYDKTTWFGNRILAVQKMLQELSPQRHIEVFLDEYNIAWTWKIKEPRMRDHKGAVFDSLFFVQAARTGIDGTQAWNEFDTGTYGKMDPQYKLRPAAHVFHYFNNWLVGQSVESRTDHPRHVVPFAVQSKNRRSFVLINRSATANSVRLVLTGWKPSATTTIETARIDATGFSTGSIAGNDLDGLVTLPPDSVTFYSASF